MLSLELASFSTATQKEEAMEEREVAIATVLADAEEGVEASSIEAKIPWFLFFLFPDISLNRNFTLWLRNCITTDVKGPQSFLLSFFSFYFQVE